MATQLFSFRLAAAVLLIGLLTVFPAAALEVPNLTGRVNDTAKMLSPATTLHLEQSLAALEREESTQLVVLTIPSLEGDNLESFALKVVETWKIGQKGLDNGALLLIAFKDRKIRIETGYGLEGSLTDLVAGRIIRERIAPHFKRGDYDQGVSDGVAAMIAAVKGEFAGKGTQANPVQHDPGAFLVVVGFGLLLIGNIFRRVKPVAAGIGGAYAPFIGFLVAGITAGAALMLLALGGAVVAYVVSLFAGSSVRHRSRFDSSFPGSGGFGGFGGGGGFGGFGGFGGGGGGSGGGGASGGW